MIGIRRSESHTDERIAKLLDGSSEFLGISDPKGQTFQFSDTMLNMRCPSMSTLTSECLTDLEFILTKVAGKDGLECP